MCGFIGLLVIHHCLRYHYLLVLSIFWSFRMYVNDPPCWCLKVETPKQKILAYSHYFLFQEPRIAEYYLVYYSHTIENCS